MLSGIGPADHLREHGIPVRVDLPAVGMNLHDHLEIHVQVETSEPVSLNREIRPSRMAKAGLQWVLMKQGPAASNLCRVGAFICSNDRVSHPNIQMHFFPVILGEDWLPLPGVYGYRLGAGPTRPTSRGNVRLASANPRESLLIDPNYLASEQDCREMREVLQLSRDVLHQPAFARFHKRERSPGVERRTVEQLDEFIRQRASSAFHPCGTCKMGPEDATDTVVDPTLSVRGLRALRIVDASVIPEIPSSNINAPVFMIAEKAADVILGKPALPAEQVDFFTRPPHVQSA